MRLMVSFLLGVAVTVPAAHAAPASSVSTTRGAATPADQHFAEFSDRVVDEWLRLEPVTATQLGDHRFDGLLPDVSVGGRAARAAMAQRQLAELSRFDKAKLAREQQVDAILLRDQLEYTLFSLQRLQDWAWDPLTYAGTLGTGLFNLVSRDFAPLPERIRSATSRLEYLPTYLGQVRLALDPARVPLIHAQTAAQQNQGLGGVIDLILAQKESLPAQEGSRLERAAERAKVALADHQTWLDKTLVPNARGNARLGAKIYDRKMALALNSVLSRAEIRQRAEREIKDLRSKMYGAAAQILKARPGAPAIATDPSPQEQQAIIEAGLGVIYADAPPRDQILPFARNTLSEAEAFAKAKDLIGFPASHFEVIEMPEYARGVAVAYADMPGPFERNQAGFFSVMPIPGEWSDEQAASFLREYNQWSIHELTIHEAVPGHLLQLAHANGYKSRLRAFLQSGPMVEGWACYTQDLMAEAGYLDRDPRYLLAHYKFMMRVPVNAILDQDFHVNGITREAAMEMMTKTAFQEEREAAGKWVRMQLSSAQLPTYFVGYQEWKDFRAAAEKRPDFELRRFHNQALSHGSPPVRFIRQLMLGEGIR